MKVESRRLARASVTLVAVVSTALVPLAPVPVFAQTVEMPAPWRRPQTPTPAAAVAAADIVRLGLTVIDGQNRTVGDLKREDVRLFEEGQEQAIVSFEKETTPVSYGLVLDNSGSLRSQINFAVASAKFIVSGNQPGDETFVTRFVDAKHIDRLQDLTASEGALQRALDEMYIEGGQTALIDALYLSADYLLKNSKPPAGGQPRRRALVLVSDGEDRKSSYKLEQLLTLLRESDIQIYCIGLVADLEEYRGIVNKFSKRDRAEGLLKRLAAETGGRVFFPESVKELREAAEEIVGNIRTQYVVGYTPTGAPPDKSFRKVEVKLADAKGKDKRKAVHRPGYAVASKVIVGVKK